MVRIDIEKLSESSKKKDKAVYIRLPPIYVDNQEFQLIVRVKQITKFKRYYGVG